jgi:fluoroquinolone transport system permease protein
MTRLLSTIRLDVLQQWRQGFYYAGAFVSVIFIIILNQLNPAALPVALPGLILMGLMVTGFYFMAGVILFEKGEGVLQQLVVTPLRTDEYLVAKLVSLTILAIAEQLAVVGLTYVWANRGLAELNVGLLVLGCVVTTVIFILLGFIVIARFDSVNEFLMPSAIIAMPMLAPLLHVGGVVDFPALLAIPTGGAALLLQAAFVPMEFIHLPDWQIAFAMVAMGVGVVVGYIYSQRTFKRFIVRGQGAKS